MTVTVNIYLCTTAKKPINSTAGTAFVIECMTSKGPATLTHKGCLENVKRNEAEILCLLEALRKLNKACELVIYCSSPYTERVLNEYLPKWEANGWKNSKGEEVNELYKTLKNALKPHKFYGKNEIHSYSEWLTREAKQEEEKCLTSMGSLTRQQS